MSIDMIRGNFGDFQQFEEGTFQHIDEIIKNMRISEKAGLQEEITSTADGVGYFVEDNRVKLAITRGDNNPFLQAIIKEGYNNVNGKLGEMGYWLNPEKTRQVVSAKLTEIFDVENLVGRVDNIAMSGYSSRPEIRGYFFEITNNSNTEQQRVMQRFGLTAKYVDAIFSGYNVESAKVILACPSVIEAKLLTEPGSLWFSLTLSQFSGMYQYGRASLHFCARWYEPTTQTRIFGKRSRGLPTDISKENPLSQHYRRILADPSEAVKAMDDHTAQGLLKIIADYKKSKKVMSL